MNVRTFLGAVASAIQRTVQANMTKLLNGSRDVAPPEVLADRTQWAEGKTTYGLDWMQPAESFSRLDRPLPLTKSYRRAIVVRLIETRGPTVCGTR